ncbi:MAG: restriction endonuclease [Peptococcaceae bacterium]|nr:restriction endonuclease [Peptococcaceae bacterium]
MSFSNWRNRREQGAFLRYYRMPKEDSRSVLGKKVDTLAGLLLIWLVSFLLLFSLTGRPAAALALSLPVFAAAAVLQKKFRAQRERRRQLQQRFWLAGQKLMEDILKMDHQKEFLPYVRDILAGITGFQNVKPVLEKKHGKDLDPQGIDLEGTYKGVPVAVRCMRREGEQKIAPDDVRAFAGALRLLGVQNGLFVTSGEFDAGVSRVVKEAARK